QILRPHLRLDREADAQKFVAFDVLQPAASELVRPLKRRTKLPEVRVVALQIGVAPGSPQRRPRRAALAAKWKRGQQQNDDEHREELECGGRNAVQTFCQTKAPDHLSSLFPTLVRITPDWSRYGEESEQSEAVTRSAFTVGQRPRADAGVGGTMRIDSVGSQTLAA